MYYRPHNLRPSAWPRRIAALFALTVLALWGFALISLALAADAPPRAAEGYRAEMIRNARYVFGMDAPIAMLGAQIEQESAWRPEARSAYAGGLAQFTPETATWISGVYKLGAAEPFNPGWALRAFVLYDRQLLDGNEGASACERWGFALSAYNGGQGWVNRDRRLAMARGADGKRWFGHVENYSTRSTAAMRENRAYPRRILLKLQPRYANWGAAVDCSGVR